MKNILNNYNQIFYRIFSTIYALIGVIFLDWSIFPIIFLFWAENFVQIIFLGITGYSSPHIRIESLDKNEKNIGQILFGKFFVNIIYLVFVLLSFVFLSLSLDKKDSFRLFMEIMRLFGGDNLSFNVAILACFLRELWLYIDNIFIKNTYTTKNPYIVGGTFGQKEIILHISILIGLGISVGLSRWIYDNFGQTEIAIFLVKYGFICFFLLLKLGVEIKVSGNKNKLPNNS